MEPLTALSLATNVVTFVDFACKLISSSYTIHNSISGLSSQNETTQTITANLNRLIQTLDLGDAKASDELRNLVRRCQTVGNELSSALQDLKTKDQGKRWSSFQAALREVGKGGRIKELHQQLERLQSSIHLYLTEKLCDPNSAICQKLASIEQINKNLEISQTRDLAKLKGEILSAISRLDSVLGSKIDIAKTAPIEGSQDESSQSTSQVLEDSNPYLGDGVGQHDVSKTCLGMQNLPSSLSELLQESQRSRAEQILLQSLTFPELGTRHRDVALAHQRTFEWIFSDDDTRGGQLGRWLREGEGIFWVAGKAGSGKSTLMKFAFEHTQTMHNLSTWASPCKLVTFEFFFWNSGTKLQKSQEGLLRSLLFEILRKDPELRATVLRLFKTFPTPRTWERSNLLASFRAIAACTATSSKFCFFIDGLDEYQSSSKNDLRDLVETLRSLVRLGNFKLCVSSRPWNIFRDELGQHLGRMVRLEDLTKTDIKLFIEDRFQTSPFFLDFNAAEPAYLDLIQQVLSKAQGVFLWVSLVVRSLLDGISNGDTIDDLLRRLEAMPGDLEGFYERILESVDIFYQSQTSKYLFIALKAREPLPLAAYSFMQAESEMRSPGQNLSPGSVTTKSIEARLEVSARRLEACCKGLLEVRSEINLSLGEIADEDPDITRKYSQDGRRSFLGTVSHGSNFCEFKVDFLHQTVKDFLLGEAGRRWITQRPGDGFDLLLLTFQSILRLLNFARAWHASTSFKLWSDIYSHLLGSALDFEQSSLQVCHKSYFKLLDEAGKAFDKMGPLLKEPVSELPVLIKSFSLSSTIEYGDSFVSICGRVGLLKYLVSKWSSIPEEYRPESSRILHQLFNPTPRLCDITIFAQFINCLNMNSPCLRHSSANQKSIWTCCWERALRSSDSPSDSGYAQISDLAPILMARAHTIERETLFHTKETILANTSDEIRQDLMRLLQKNENDTPEEVRAPVVSNEQSFRIFGKAKTLLKMRKSRPKKVHANV